MSQTKHHCPIPISDRFYDDKPRGREEVLTWLKTLDIKIGDTVWVPELGYYEKLGPGEQ